MDFTYLWPPRPTQAVAKPMLGFYQKRGFVAQKKKNGTCTVIFAKGDQVIFKTRHNDDHKLWTPLPEHIKFFQGSAGLNVFTAELLHSKVSGGPKHQLYIFDQLVRNGVSLVGTTFGARSDQLLADLGGQDDGDQYRASDYVSVARNYRSGFTQLFENLKKEDEGLVLKNPGAALKACLKPDANGSWMVKCRIANANYSF